MNTSTNTDLCAHDPEDRCPVCGHAMATLHDVPADEPSDAELSEVLGSLELDLESLWAA